MFLQQAANKCPKNHLKTCLIRVDTTLTYLLNQMSFYS